MRLSTKINPSGSALVYSTYLNGASGNGIAVDSDGNAYITGEAGTTKLSHDCRRVPDRADGFRHLCDETECGRLSARLLGALWR